MSDPAKPRNNLFQSALIAALTFLAITVVPASRAGTPSPSQSWKVDLGGDPGRIPAAIDQLLDPDPSVWREAQIRLAAAGRPAMEALNKSKVIRDPAGATRVKLLVSLALHISLSTEELDRYPRLRALGESDIQKGLALAETLRSFRSLAAEGFRPSGGDIQRSILALGGFKVYAGRALIRDSNPAARANGALILGDVETTVAEVDQLLDDDAVIGINGSDWSMHRDVAYAARSRRSPLVQSNEADRSTWFEHLLSRTVASGGSRNRGPHERQPPWDFDLINAFRQASASMDAENWDDWWREIRPTWKHWWKLAGNGPYPPDREDWLNYLNEMDGFRYFSKPDSLGRSILHVTGPPGTRYELFRDSVLVGAGGLPFDSIGPPDPELAEEWLYTIPDAEDLIEMRLRFSDGSSRTDWWPLNGEVVNIVILGPQRRERPGPDSKD